MDLHSPKIKGRATLDEAATYDEAKDLVPREFVDERAAGIIVIRDITPQDALNFNTGEHTYEENTIPSEFALKDVVSDTTAIRVHFECEPDRSKAAAKITINGKTPNSIDAVPGNSRLYTGFVDLDLDPAMDGKLTTITAISETGQSHSCQVNLQLGGPEFQGEVTIKSLPAGQTHVKDKDRVVINGIVSNKAIGVYVQDSGASDSVQEISPAGPDTAGEGWQLFEASIEVGTSDVDAPFTLIAESLLGTESDPVSTANLPIDQTVPVITFVNAQYPAGQEAVKLGEEVVMQVQVDDATSVAYGLSANFAMTEDMNTYEEYKTITLTDDTGHGYHNDPAADKDYTVEATKASNGTMTTVKYPIKSVNVPTQATIIISGNPAALRTDADGNTYKVQIQTNQRLLDVPVLSAEHGTVGSFVRKSDYLYEADFTVADADPRGTHKFTGLLAIGLSGIEKSTIDGDDDYIIAGFLVRDLVVPALSQKVAIGVPVVNPNNIVAHYKDADELSYLADKTVQQAAFTIVDADGNLNPQGDHLWISDEAFAGTNTSGTLMLTIEEGV